MATVRISDLALARGSNTYMGYMPEKWLVIYHMLRCAGWDWVWECDGSNGIALAPDANHVPDGNMEAADASAFTATGATIQKVTSEVKEGLQSLEITGQTPDTIETSTITIRVPQIANQANISGTAPNMTITNTTNNNDFSKRLVGVDFVLSGCDDSNNDGTFTITGVTDRQTLTYQNASGVADAGNASANWYLKVPVHIAMWVKNPGVETWNVDVDRGNGADFNVGSFAQTTGGDWELLHFDFAVQGTGNITITLKPQGAGDTTIYVDSIMCWRSGFEYASVDGSTKAYVDYADGSDATAQVQNGDEFLSSAYSFVAADVGKHLFLYDTSGSNPKNSGCYEIQSVAGGVATLNMRSTTRQFTNQTDDFNWRMVDIYSWADVSAVTRTNENAVDVFNGYCLQSPYSNWRFVVRGHWVYLQDNGVYFWGAPTDADLDKQTGEFYSTPDISMQSGLYGDRTISEKNWATNSAGQSDPDGLQWMRGRAGDATYTSRLMMLLDEDGKFFVMATNPGNVICTAGAFGYFAEDIYHPGAQAFLMLTPRNDASANNNMSGGTTRDYLDWVGSTPAFGYQGTGIGVDGFPKRSQVLLVGLDDAQDKEGKFSNAQANPFSGDEFIRPMIVALDPDGDQGSPSEREIGTEGVYMGRWNMTDMEVFGSDGGVGDSFAFATPTVTLTDSAGLFTAAMDGHPITITNATTPGNNGTFTLTYISATQVSWSNASGAAEAFTGEWRVNMGRYLHVHKGFVLQWDEEMLA